MANMEQDMNEIFVDTDVFIVADEHDFVTIDENQDFLSDAIMIDMSQDDLLDVITIDMDADSDIFVSLDDDVIVSDFVIEDNSMDMFDISFADDITMV